MILEPPPLPDLAHCFYLMSFCSPYREGVVTHFLPVGDKAQVSNFCAIYPSEYNCLIMEEKEYTSHSGLDYIFLIYNHEIRIVNYSVRWNINKLIFKPRSIYQLVKIGQIPLFDLMIQLK